MPHKNLYRKEAIAIYKQVCELLEGTGTKYEFDVMHEYIDALRYGLIEKLCYFKLFGPDPYHIVRNFSEYKLAESFGFNHWVINEHGWIEHFLFEVEEIEFNIPKEKIVWNKIKLGKSPNGLWVYALSYQFGGSGGSTPISVFLNPYNNRYEALMAALKKFHELSICAVQKCKSDTTNFNPLRSKYILKAIEERICKEHNVTIYGQLEMF